MNREEILFSYVSHSWRTHPCALKCAAVRPKVAQISLPCQQQVTVWQQLRNALAGRWASSIQLRPSRLGLGGILLGVCAFGRSSWAGAVPSLARSSSAGSRAW